MSPSMRDIVSREDFDALAAIFTRGTKLGDRAKDPLSWTSRSVILTRVASELKLPNGWYRAYLELNAMLRTPCPIPRLAGDR